MKRIRQQGESEQLVNAGTDPLAREDLREISEQIAREFPLTGGESGVVLMDVDPYRLHAYWSLDAESLEQSRAEFGTAGGRTHLVLRFREVPGDALGHRQMAPLAVFDLEISEAQGSTEVRIWGAGKTYEAELGFTAEDGGWMSLACSNRVRMPPAGPSSKPALATLDVSSLAPAVHFEAADAQPNSVSPDKILGATAVETATAGAQDLPMADDPSLRGGGPDQLDPEFPNPYPAEHALKLAPETAEQVQPNLPEPANGYFKAESVQTLSSSAFSLSSFAQADAELEIHAELHIYGHARPDREILLFGRRVPLESNGTFHIRQILRADASLLALLLPEVGNQSESE